MNPSGDDPFTAKLSFEVSPPAPGSLVLAKAIVALCYRERKTRDLVTTKAAPAVIGPVVCLPAAGWVGVRPRGGRSCSATLHEPPGCACQTLAPTPALAVLPFTAARCRHHHVPLLLSGTHLPQGPWGPRGLWGRPSAQPQASCCLSLGRCSTPRTTSCLCFSTAAVPTVAGALMTGPETGLTVTPLPPGDCQEPATKAVLAWPVLQPLIATIMTNKGLLIFLGVCILADLHIV